MTRRSLLQLALAGGATSRLNIGGTFLQLMPWHRDWPEARWRELFGYYRALGLKEVIVQWTVTGSTALYPAPLETILRVAREAGIAVDLGLRSDPDYWRQIQGPPATVAAYLRRLATESTALASHIRRREFRGWYISEEIDDINWREPARRTALLEYLHSLSNSLHNLKPSRPIAISGFAQAQSDPATFTAFWRDTFRHTRIQTLLVQDGIGTGKLTLPDVARINDAAALAAHREHRNFRPIVELFQQAQADPFHGIPAPAARIERQVALARRWGLPLAFSVMEYMTPLGVEGAAELYRTFAVDLVKDPRR